MLCPKRFPIAFLLLLKYLILQITTFYNYLITSHISEKGNIVKEGQRLKNGQQLTGIATGLTIKANWMVATTTMNHIPVRNICTMQICMEAV